MKRSTTSGVVHVGIRYVLMLQARISRNPSFTLQLIGSYAKCGFALYALIPSTPRRTKTHTLRCVSGDIDAYHSYNLPCSEYGSVLPQDPSFNKEIHRGRERRKSCHRACQRIQPPTAKQWFYVRPPNIAPLSNVPCSASNLSSSGISASVLNRA